MDAPAPIVTEPDAPPTALPVCKVKSPDCPELDEPVWILTPPLLGDAAVEMLASPLAPVSDLPLVTSTEPPACCALLPADTSMDPPIEFAASWFCNTTLPDDDSTEAPVPIITLPVVPLSLLPVCSCTAPLAPDVSALPDFISTDPLTPAVLPPEDT